MSFSQATITEVYPPAWTGSSIHLEWTSTAPSGTVFQVYANGKLAWSGLSRWVDLPMPSGKLHIDVGTVGPGEAATDFSASLAPTPQDRARLSWLGGTYLVPDGSDDVVGFHVYGGDTPGAAVDFTTPLATIGAYPGGILNDGFGLGGFGQGGFGRAASAYGWTSPSLARGAWSFAIVPFDEAGNPGTPMTTQVTIVAPPGAPAPADDGTRLAYSYNETNRQITLTWQPSPG